MNNSTTPLDSLGDNFQQKLPLTYRFLESMTSSRNQVATPHTSAIINIKFYESKSIEPSGFYRPISKTVILASHE